MPDPERFKPAHPTPTRQAKPGQQLWTLRKNGRQVDCELRFHGESYGWECQWLHDSELAYGRRFVTHAGALKEAEGQRQRLIGRLDGPQH
jgi:hypothetical protein